ncbi:hypothetical protein [Sphingomonas colocasiae]|uniref:17 kDa surface antigen n=1 Tax=Sphingomonas colocasiae TaxID=1848973 RepID=A0ABS7PUG4_9SPHN|nr:hypothetical protein [Sphingomonas colocasiae]MBY8824993.1 hypothetical protein [Sphingomonas colocasiae]
MKQGFSRYLAATAAAASIFAAMPAVAATPGDVRDLVGARASSGENALADRGYSLTHSEQGDDRTWGYWWNRSSKQCITVATVEGRYDSITGTLPADCNQKAGGGGSGGAVAAAGIAAALIGVAALAHKSHHHDDGNHYDNDRSEADFERGHRDGLYGQSYQNFGRSDPYVRGYESGVRRQGRETGYRDDHRRAGGYQSAIDVSDLQGARGSSADSEMRNRGFANVDALKSGNTAYTIWYSRATRQCMQMGVADGRVVNLVDIGSSPKCR